ncbi:hypothetical protein B0J11DRAFT_100229 [Dendryphion nanum]|uniref:Uncharacterized protein n=1 Tax=Dendryphion nanum TaxID=256645 RepID=A0A9P9IEC4_9PLEO|nr:hypothetical protein B0J11DRAFT_100229 [Dendryphion nanum]
MSTIDKVKDALHIRRKSKPDVAAGESSVAGHTHTREHDEEPRSSVDSEVARMTPAEREAYLKEYDETDHFEPKKGSLIDRLIARGNKATEDQLREEHEARQTAKRPVA